MTRTKRTAPRPIANVMRKEWIITWRNPNNILFVTLVPVLITVQMLVYIFLAMRFAGAKLLFDTILQGAVERWLEQFSVREALSQEQQLLVFFFGQFPLYALLIPCMVSLSFATFSIVEEKQTRTLEPLLATPVRTSELLLGKALSGLIPSIIMSFFCTAVFLLGILAMGEGGLIHTVLNLQWWVSLFLLVPLVSLLTFMLGVTGSSRAKDSKSAQNIAVVVVLPIIGLVVIQVLGIVLFSLFKLLLLSALLIILNVVVLRLAVRIFSRETILISWK
jgi:ABC-2 type transport system permease protein